MTTDAPLSPADPNQPKLRILVCLLYYVPHRTGLTIHVQRVAEELVSRGHDVTVLTARHDRALDRDATHSGVRIVRLWAPIRISRGMLMPAYPWAAWRLMRQHDVASVHTPMLETALLSSLSSLTGTQLVVTHHGDLVLPPGRLNRLIVSTVLTLYGLLARRSPRILAYSDDYANHSSYLQPFADKVSVVYPPITLPEPQADRVAGLRAAWQREGAPIIGFAGRFVREKRPDVAIRALATVHRSYPRSRLVFAGEYDIEYESTWETEAPLVAEYHEHLVFLGLLDDPQDMANFYAACDVLVLTSDTECFALVQVEAMLCGTPVVMTDIPGGRVPVAATGMGLLTTAGDAVSVGEAIVNVIDDPTAFAKPRAEIEGVFSFQNTIDQYETHLRAHARQR